MKKTKKKPVENDKEITKYFMYLKHVPDAQIKPLPKFRSKYQEKKYLKRLYRNEY